MKYIIFVLILILLSSFVQASEDCGLTNLSSCLPEKAFYYIFSQITSPIQFLSDLTFSLLNANVAVEGLKPVWQIIVYALSLIYGLFLVIAGFQFIISGHSPELRLRAKEWLKNTIYMIVVVNASFFIYLLCIELSSAFSTALLSLIDRSFFGVQIDSFSNIATSFLFSFLYLLILLLTLIILGLRYLIVAAGVLIFPLAIVLVTIPLTRQWGKGILNFIFVFVFLPIPFSIILLIASYFINVPPFENLTMFVAMLGYLLANLFTIYLIKIGGFDVFSASKNIVMATVAVKSKLDSANAKNNQSTHRRFQ